MSCDHDGCECGVGLMQRIELPEHLKALAAEGDTEDD